MLKTPFKPFILLIPLLMTSLAAQDAAPPPPPPSSGHPGPKNLKLLQPDELMSTMRAFKTALGQECTFCHVKGDFSSDENPHKGIARNMIVMAREINAKFPDGKTHVTCYTCHRGSEEPLTAPAH